MPQTKIYRQSSGLQTTRFNEDHWSTSKNIMSAVSTTVCRTGIVCELGSSTKDTSTLTHMIENGMTVAKINCSKAPHEYYNTIIDNLRTAVADCSRRLDVSLPVAVALEIEGLHIHTGTLKKGLPEGVNVKEGSTVKIVLTKCFEENCSSEVIWMSYPQLGLVLQKDYYLFIDYGKIFLKVLKSDADSIQCTVLRGGLLGSKKEVFIPGITLSCLKDPSVFDSIQNHLQWGITRNIDMVFASLTETAEGVKTMKHALGNKGKHIKIFSKIENFEGLTNFNEILKAADGIVLVRDRLSKFIPPEDMFSAQKLVVSQCNKEGKPVVVTGQVLESMLAGPQPSRSDCSDISTLVLDGADCVELTAETAEGRYPVETVACLSKVCRAAETTVLQEQIFLERSGEIEGRVEASHASAIAAVKAAFKSHAKCIICITRTGNTAFLLAKYSPPCPVIAVTRDPKVAKECLLFRALLPVIYEAKVESDLTLDVEGNVRYAIKYGMALNILNIKDSIIVLSVGKDTPGFTVSVRVAVETVDRYIDTDNFNTRSVEGASGVIH